MPSDRFYGGAGVEVLYPNHMMNNLPFSEPDWNTSTMVSRHPPVHDAISSCGMYLFENQAPMPATDFDNTYSTTRIPPPIELSPLPGHVMTYPRPKSSPSTFGPNVEDLLFPENPFRIKADDGYPPPVYSMSPAPMPQKAASPYMPSDFSFSTNPVPHQTELQSPLLQIQQGCGR